jgi:hypothetical protein
LARVGRPFGREARRTCRLLTLLVMADPRRSFFRAMIAP